MKTVHSAVCGLNSSHLHYTGVSPEMPDIAKPEQTKQLSR